MLTLENVDITYPVDGYDLQTTRRILAEARADIQARFKQAAEAGLPEWTGTTVAIVIEDSYEVLGDDGCRHAAEWIARVGAKTGYLLAVHGSGAAPLPDGSPPLREFGGSSLLRDFAATTPHVVYVPATPGGVATGG